MNLLTVFFLILSSFFHIIFFVVETILFVSPKVHRRFGLASEAEMKAAKPFALHLGLYNLFLASGGFLAVSLYFLSLVREAEVLSLWTSLFMLLAAIALLLTKPSLYRGALFQGIPPLLVLLSYL